MFAIPKLAYLHSDFMKIFNQKQLQDWDRHTIAVDGIPSLHLIEEAGQLIAEEIETRFLATTNRPVRFFCGMGNNGADGLVAASILSTFVDDIEVNIIKHKSQGTPEFEQFLANLENTKIPIRNIHTVSDLLEVPFDALLIDAIIGIGINDGLKGLPGDVVEFLNDQEFVTRIALDYPTGLHPDKLWQSNAFRADTTLSIGSKKLSSFFMENEEYIGTLITLPFRLSDNFYMQTESKFRSNELVDVMMDVHEESEHAFKNDFGHVLIVGGSLGMLGAAQFATEGAMRAGCGLATAHVPFCGVDILQMTIPEAMVSMDPGEDYIKDLPDLSKYDTVCFGCGLGQKVPSSILREILETSHMTKVIDADGLNLLSKNPELYELLDETCILTPHVGEFHRLFGLCFDSSSRLELLMKKALAHKCYIILKGHHSLIATPKGNCYINTTGNSILATAGSGDVLAGYLAGLLARGMKTSVACRRAVSLHGFAGDLLRQEFGKRGAIARDLLSKLSKIETHYTDFMQQAIDHLDSQDGLELDLLDNLN